MVGVLERFLKACDHLYPIGIAHSSMADVRCTHKSTRRLMLACVLNLKMLRPAARVVIDAEHLEHAALNAIGDDNVDVGDQELAGSEHAAPTAAFGVIAELHFERPNDNEREAQCGLGVARNACPRKQRSALG